MYIRQLKPTKNNSFFLFGARGTGKTTLLKNIFSTKSSLVIDLLDPSLAGRLQAYPDEFSKMILGSKKKWIFVDEVQKIPPLLDLVHKHIEEDGKKFILTGSSARKLKRGSANLLAGRAFVYKLFPLTHRELGDKFNLNEVLSFGSLPKIFSLKTKEDKKLFLSSYADTYLKEEILLEQIIRNLPPFRRFLDISAHLDTEQISLSNIAKDIGSDPKTVSKYYSILEDTLLGFFLEPYHISIRKRQKTAPKFYWFDAGIVRSLTGSIENKLLKKSFEYGKLFESFIINEIYRILTYQNKKFAMSFTRTKENAEIDLILERPGMPTCLVEIKSTDYVTEKHLLHLKSFLGDFKNAKAFCLSNDPNRKAFGKIQALPWEEGLKEMGI